MTSPSETPGTWKRLSLSAKTAIIAIPAVLVLVLVLIVVTLLNRPAIVQPGDTQSGSGDPSVPMVLGDSHVLDDAGADAPTLVEFLDFECPACGSVYPIIEDIREQYDGEINYVVRHFPLSGHANAMNAALSVEAASQQGKFDEMFHLMYTTQAEWHGKQESEAQRFRGYAEQLGLDLEQYDEAVADPATQARVEEDYNAGVALGVSTTPTFFLDGEMLDLEYVSDLTNALDAAIAASK